MDQTRARQLFLEGSVLILLDVPEGSEIGIDYNSWNVGPRFKGIKMIPAGFHFIYYSSVSREGQTAPRTGFFHFFKPKELLVKRWDAFTEELNDKNINDVLLDSLRASLIDLDSSLGPYPYETFKKWTTLTNYITEALVARIEPLNRTISSVTQVNVNNEVVMTTVTDRKDTSDNTSSSGKAIIPVPSMASSLPDCPVVPQTGGFFAGVGNFHSIDVTPSSVSHLVSPSLSLTPNKDSILRFSTIPNQKHPAGSTPTEITQHNLDLSFTLESLLHVHDEEDESHILGELQLAFVCFIVGQVYEAFEQWKQLVRLLCYSEESLVKHGNLFKGFLSCIHFQLKEVPDDFFVDIVSRNNFLTTTLQVFFSNISECDDLDEALRKKALQFRDHLTKKYKWDFTSEPDEDAPTIVDLN